MTHQDAVPKANHSQNPMRFIRSFIPYEVSSLVHTMLSRDQRRRHPRPCADWPRKVVVIYARLGYGQRLHFTSPQLLAWCSFGLTHRIREFPTCRYSLKGTRNGWTEKNCDSADKAREPRIITVVVLGRLFPAAAVSMSHPMSYRVLHMPAK